MKPKIQQNLSTKEQFEDLKKRLAKIPLHMLSDNMKDEYESIVHDVDVAQARFLKRSRRAKT